MKIQNPRAKANIRIRTITQGFDGKTISRSEEYDFHEWEDQNTIKIDAQLWKMGWGSSDGFPWSHEELETIKNLHEAKKRHIADMRAILGVPTSQADVKAITEAYMLLT